MACVKLNAISTQTFYKLNTLHKRSHVINFFAAQAFFGFTFFKLFDISSASWNSFG